MTDPTIQRATAFVRPLYQDLDGASRFDEVERVARIARRLHPEPTRMFELLILFHGLGKWLDRVGSVSRALLAVPGLTEGEMQEIVGSIRRLENPQTESERAIAAAQLVDAAGVRGLIQRFITARREGLTVVEVVREELARDAVVPDWLPPQAADMIAERRRKRLELCEQILNEG